LGKSVESSIRDSVNISVISPLDWLAWRSVNDSVHRSVDISVWMSIITSTRWNIEL
jgi:hypothetical protein